MDIVAVAAAATVYSSVPSSSFVVVVVVVVFAIDSSCNAVSRSWARCGDGLVASTMSSRSDLAKDENTASLLLRDAMIKFKQ